MTQFLINYWWIILFAILITSIVIKKFVKFIIIFIIFVIIYVLFWEIYIAPSLSKANQCLTTLKADTIAIADKTNLMTDENQKTQTICSEDNLNYAKFMDCVNTSKNENGISFTFFINTPAYKKIISTIIDSHNEICPTLPLTIPSFN